MSVENTSYTVMEDVGVAEVCAVVSGIDYECPIEAEFSLIFRTHTDSAGTVKVYSTVLTTL